MAGNPGRSPGTVPDSVASSRLGPVRREGVTHGGSHTPEAQLNSEYKQALQTAAGSANSEVSQLPAHRGGRHGGRGVRAGRGSGACDTSAGTQAALLTLLCEGRKRCTSLFPPWIRPAANMLLAAALPKTRASLPEFLLPSDPSVGSGAPHSTPACLSGGGPPRGSADPARPG